jgi:hypothetical protein
LVTQPVVAAYFAVRGVLQELDTLAAKRGAIEEYCKVKSFFFDKTASVIAAEGYENTLGRSLAVWAFDKAIDGAFQYGRSQPCPYEIVTVPCASNPHIRAQQGLFTLVRTPLNLESIVDRRSFDEILAGTPLAQRYDPTKMAFLSCFQLEWEHSFEVLRLLAKLGVAASSIFPGYGGACETVSERRWWSKG